MLGRDGPELCDVAVDEVLPLARVHGADDDVDEDVRVPRVLLQRLHQVPLGLPPRLEAHRAHGEPGKEGGCAPELVGQLLVDPLRFANLISSL